LGEKEHATPKNEESKVVEENNERRVIYDEQARMVVVVLGKRSLFLSPWIKPYEAFAGAAFGGGGFLSLYFYFLDRKTTR